MRTKIPVAFSLILVLLLPTLLFLSVYSAGPVFSDGFESGDFSAWTATVQNGATIGVTSGSAHTGMYEATIAGLQSYGSYAFLYKTLPSTYADLYARAYVEIDSKPPTSEWYDMGIDIDGDVNGVGYSLISKPVFNPNTNQWGIRVYTGGTYVTYYESGTSTVNAGEWYCVEQRTFVDGNGFVTLWVNGALKLNQTGFSTNEMGNATYALAGYRWVESALGSSLAEHVDDFVVDTSYIGLEPTVPPSIAILSPQNTTYNTPDVPLNYNVNELTSWMGYSLDGQDNVTVSGNMTLIGLSNEPHQVIVYANDTHGNMGSSGPVYFTVQSTYTLTVSTVGSGSVSLNDSGPYYYGDVVQMTADPIVGWSFSGWSGDLSGSANPATLTIAGNMSVTATFTQNTYTLNISVAGSGIVNLNNTGPYFYGDVVELTAVPNTGWSFEQWSGDLSSSTNPTTITLDDNMSVTATFTQNVYALTVSYMGSGSVTLNESGPYYYGDVVQMTADPIVGWSFSGWSGDLSGSANPATLTIAGNMSVTATFTQNTYTLNISVAGSGIVNLNNTGPYYYGNVVQLTAHPNVGWSFSNWSGNATGTANPTSVIITGNETVTATFIQNVYTLTLSTSGSGTISLNITGPYHYGQTVLLWALPQTGWTFQYWSGDLSGSVNPATMIMTGNFSVTATFASGPADIAMTNVDFYKTVIGQGYSGNITVTAENLGGYTETFNITIYANTTYIASQNITLSSGNSADVIFTWNTTGFAYGNYTISAYAWPVPGETNTANNNFTGDVMIKVTLPGDVNGDFKVSLQDLVLMAVAYGTTPASGGTIGALHAWNPKADIDGNAIVGLSDLVILAQHYGQHYP